MRYRFAIVAVLALVVAACGSSGGGTPAPTRASNPTARPDADPRPGAPVWANNGPTGNTIGGANLDGTDVVGRLIAGGARSVLRRPQPDLYLLGDPVRRHDRPVAARWHVVNLNFVTTIQQPCGVAVDGAHVYWAGFGSGTIGRSNLDGSTVNVNFITGLSTPCGVAIDADHSIGRRRRRHDRPGQS